MDTIVLGYDASEGAERALARAAELAEALGAGLLVTSVAPPTTLAEAVPAMERDPMLAPAIPAAGLSATRAAFPLPFPEEQRPEPIELAEHQLDRARTRLSGRRVEAEYLADVGDAAERLLALARERGADLIVVGSREHGFLDRLLGRHVDEEVAAHAACDVLLVH
jgi:nucleotide-binding universal stress UspA family protein